MKLPRNLYSRLKGRSSQGARPSPITLRPADFLANGVFEKDKFKRGSAVARYDYSFDAVCLRARSCVQTGAAIRDIPNYKIKSLTPSDCPFNQGSGIVCKLGDTPNADHVVGSAPPLTQLLIFDRGLATANIEVHVDTTNTQAWKVVTELWDTAWTTFEAGRPRGPGRHLSRCALQIFLPTGFLKRTG